jgi:dTDP-4-dehydrorhamnose reductase
MKVKKILISGGSGEFTKYFCSICNDKDFELFPLQKSEMDVTDISQIESAIEEINPDYFIHAGALTRPMAIHENSPDRSILNNIIGTANVVLSCMKNNIKLIYLSTDHVYQGEKGNYSEEDPVMPVNNYAWSKLGGECSVMLYKNSCILRLAMVKNPFPHDAAIADSYKSSIFINDAAKISLSLIDKCGTYNIGGDKMSIYNFAKKSNPSIKKIFLKDIIGVKMPTDVSMNLEKMRNILKND